MRKKYLFIIILLFLFLFKLNGVLAVTIEYEGDGQSGLTSPGCGTGNCMNTIFYNGGTSAIYGIRITVMSEDKTKIIKAPINFWATDGMVNEVVSNKITKLKNYNNLTDPTNKLWKSVGLRQIDRSGYTYASFVKSLKFEDLSKFVEKFGLSPDDKNVQKYYLKIEPIFVAHHYGKYVTENYYSGTAREMINYFYNNNCSAVAVINTSNFHVISNYLTTIYDGNPNTDVDKKSLNNVCGVNLYTYNIYNNGNPDSNLGIGYVRLKDVINGPTKIKLCKRLGTYEEDSSWYKKNVNFVLREVEKNGNVGSKNIQESTYKYENGQVTCALFEGLDPNKTYVVGEEVNSDVISVEYRKKINGDIAGVYSGDLGGQDNYGSVEYIFSSPFKTSESDYNYFYIMAFNKEKNMPSNSLIVTKFKGEPSNYGDFDNAAFFNLKKAIPKDSNNPTDCTGATVDNNFSLVKTKEYNDKKVVFKNLETGCYILNEYYLQFEKVVHGVNKVIFRGGVNSKDYSFDLGEYTINSEDSFDSKTFYIGEGKNYIAVFNDTGDGNCGCSCELKKIKDNANASNDEETIYKLEELYTKYNNYNLILNYGYKDGKLDISSTSCATSKCSISSSSSASSNLSCGNGNVDYKLDLSNITYENSNDVNEIVTDRYERACYGSIYSGVVPYYYSDFDLKCGITYSYTTDFISDNKVNAGQLLWERLPNYNNVGNLSIGVKCSKSFKSGEYNLDDMKLKSSIILNDIKPSMRIYLKNDSNVDTGINIDIKKYENDEISYDSSLSGCSGDYCYGYWNKEYKLPLSFDILFYLTNSVDKYGYFTKISTGTIGGYGLPIGLNVKSGYYNATLSFKTKYTINETNKLDCKYHVISPGSDPDCPSGDCPDPDCPSGDCPDPDCPFGNCPDPNPIKNNISFRIIDINNPFPGIDGLGRLTGNNWCIDSKVYKRTTGEDGNIYYIGDIRSEDGSLVSDGKITSIDYSIDGLDDINVNNDKHLLLTADIDGDGVVTFPKDINNCNSDMSDLCILKRYVDSNNSLARKMNCQSEPDSNFLVKKYITGDDNTVVPNSYSDGQPMYSFTLTPTDIQNIRAYNKEHAYSDSNYDCPNGLECKSNFLTDWLKNHQQTNTRCYNDRIMNNWCSNN